MHFHPIEFTREDTRMMTTRRFFVGVMVVQWLLALPVLASTETRVDTLKPPIVRTSVALFDLECDDIPPTALRILTDVIRAELVRSDRFELIDRAHVQKILTEQKFQHTGTVTEATMVQMGALIGASKIVTGRIGWLGRVRVITLQLIDVSTGRVDQLEATDFVGEVEHMRRPVRAATQRLIGIGGFLDLRGGFIHIVSRPLGATVHVSGLYEGTTPVQVWVDSVGSFPVKVMHPGCAMSMWNPVRRRSSNRHWFR
jgi:peptidoglycan-synthase activator LpoB